MRRLLGALSGLVLIAGLALPVLANGQDTCPEGDGWVKVDGLDGQTYTFDVPEGFEVTDNCFKAGNDLMFGSGSTVENTTVFNQNGKLRDISHASFLLVEIEEEEEPTTTTVPEETTTTEPEESTSTTLPEETTTTTVLETTTTVADDPTEIPTVTDDEVVTPTVITTTTTAAVSTTDTTVLAELPFTGPEDTKRLVQVGSLLGLLGTFLVIAGQAWRREQ